MRTKTLLGAAALLGASLLPVTASAQQISTQRAFDVQHFEPSDRGSEWFGNESLDFRGNFRPAFGVVADYSYRSLVIFQNDGDVRGSVVRNEVMLHPGASFVLFDRLRLAVDVPLQTGVDGHVATVERDGVITTLRPPPNSGALGDIRFGADARLLGVYGDPITLGRGHARLGPDRQARASGSATATRGSSPASWSPATSACLHVRGERRREHPHARQ